jgi:hypothetical protein
MELVALLIAAPLAISFAGFLAWKVAAPPLIIIVAICSGLMVYALCDDAFGRAASEIDGQ